MDNVVTFELTHCSDSLPEGIQITLTGLDYPFLNLIAISDTSGIVVFESVIDGNYNLLAYKPGYEIYEHLNLSIEDDLYYSIILTEIVHPPQNLEVDPLTSFATWDNPTIIKLPNETFEDTSFPPVGWQSSSLGMGWYRSDITTWPSALINVTK